MQIGIEKKVKKYINYVLVFLLVASSGFQYFYINDEWIIIGILISTLVLINNKLSIIFDRKFILIFILFIFWELLQFYSWGNLRIISVIGTASRLIFCYLVIKILQENFIKVYVKLISLICIISLLFYLMFFIGGITETLISLSEPFKNGLFGISNNDYGLRNNIIIFNFHGYEFDPKRNSGPFWEPGAYSIFIIIALLLDHSRINVLLTKRTTLFIVTIITTFSTAGYLALFLIIIYKIIDASKKKNYKILILPILIVILIQLFISVDFLFTKIVDNIEVADYSTGSRFGSALADIQLIKESPIIGYGRNIQAMYDVSEFNIEFMHRNNGITKLFVTWGILAIVYLINIYISMQRISQINKLNNGYGLIAFLIILLMSFSQVIFQYPFFYGLMFIQFIKFRKY